MPFDLSNGAPRRIAIIGGGIAGLACAYLLAGHHDVTLFEAAPRFGGHARTVLAGQRGNQPVDTGFIVFNHVNYPHLTALFRDLDVPLARSDMSFGVTLDDGRLEYALRGNNAVFGQRRNLLDPGFYGLIRDILRFNSRIETLAEQNPDLTIAEMAGRMQLGPRFAAQYLYPLCGAIWSTPDMEIGSFPAGALMRFMRNHGLLSRKTAHQWWTVDGGSVAYVDRLVAHLVRAGVTLCPATPVVSVGRTGSIVTIRASGDVERQFDRVILATHADQALALLADPDPEEKSALSSVRFQQNRAVLHADATQMPRQRRCWASWISHGDSPSGAVGVTYWMNNLQNIPASDPLFVTLNPSRPIDPRLIQDETSFAHPVFDRAAVAAQATLAGRQGRRNTFYAGAWLRNGFHEDGFASALRVARRLLPAQVAP